MSERISLLLRGHHSRRSPLSEGRYDAHCRGLRPRPGEGHPAAGCGQPVVLLSGARIYARPLELKLDCASLTSVRSKSQGVLHCILQFPDRRTSWHCVEETIEQRVNAGEESIK